MRKVKNGAVVLCEAPAVGYDDQYNVVLCDWDGESVSWLEFNGDTIQGCYRGDAIPGFLRRAGMDSLNGWYEGRAR